MERSEAAMRTRIWISGAAVIFSSALAALAQPTAPYDILALPQSTCFSPGGTIAFQVETRNLTTGALLDPRIFVCAGANPVSESAGPSNAPAGGSFSSSTCSLGFGGTWSTSGSWTPGTQDIFFFGFAVPSNPGPTLPFQFSVSDATHPLISMTSSLPQCAAAGTVLQITKSVGTGTKLVNGHVREGDFVEFDVTVKNVGSEVNPSPFTITDTFAAGLGTPDSAGCDLEGNTITCMLSTPLGPGQFITIPISSKVTAKGDYDNVAMVTGGGAPPATSNTASVEVLGPRPNPVRIGTPPIRDLSGRPTGN